MRRKREILRASKKLRKKRLFRKIIFFFLFFLLFVFSFVSFFYLPYLRIKKISLEGNSLINSEKLIAGISSYLQGKQLKIFPRDNIFILPKKDLEENTLSNFPRIKELDINPTFPDGLSLKVKERNNEALFCLEKREEGCAFIDEDGFVFEPAPYFSAGVYLSFIDEATSTWKQGFQVLPQEQFKKLIDFKNLAKTENIKIIDIILKKEGIYQLNTSEGWYILLNEKNESQLSFENLKTILDSSIKNQRLRLEYLDLRFGNKVFYKFK